MRGVRAGLTLHPRASGRARGPPALPWRCPQSLPPKNERVLRVGMTPLQRQYYRWILSRNFRELNKARAPRTLWHAMVRHAIPSSPHPHILHALLPPLQGAKGQMALLNIIVELKKCCNHPFLFESAEARATRPPRWPACAARPGAAGSAGQQQAAGEANAQRQPDNDSNYEERPG